MPHIKPHPEVTAIATRAFEEDIVLAHVLDRAGVASSTWTRAKRKGMKPQGGTLAKLNTALDELIQERNDREGGAPVIQPSATETDDDGE